MIDQVRLDEEHIQVLAFGKNHSHAKYITVFVLQRYLYTQQIATSLRKKNTAALLVSLSVYSPVSDTTTGFGIGLVWP